MSLPQVIPAHPSSGQATTAHFGYYPHTPSHRRILKNGMLHPQPFPTPAAMTSTPELIGPELIAALVAASHEFDGSGKDPERNCWLAVHRHVHGVLPSEYDIREVPEELYLAVLAQRRHSA